MRRTLTTVAFASALLALAGCGATAPAAPTPTAAHGEPTVPPVADPSSRVPLVCDQLASASTVEAIAGPGLAPVSAVIQPDLPTIAPLATLQYGQLDCAWSREPSLTYDQSPPLITISVVPEVPSAYWAATLAMSQGVTTGTFPGDSIVYCPSQCRLDILVDGYWMSATVALDTQVTLEQATPLFSAAVEAIATAAAPAARWTAPTAGARAVDSELVDRAAVVATLGAAAMEGIICGPTVQAQEHWVAQAESGYANCVYALTGLPGNETAYVDIEYLPGGAWGFDAAAATMNPAITALPQLGVEAFSSPNGPETTSILFIRKGDLVLLSVYPYEGAEPSPASVVSIAEAIAPALP